MRAIVLAAGKGERLKEITSTTPKPMIKIRGKPVLEYNINWLNYYGIKDIYINLHHLPDLIKDYFNGGSKWGVRITYSYESELLGTAGAVRKIAEEHWHLRTNNYYLSDAYKDLRDSKEQKEKDTFVVIYGDNLFGYNLKEIIDFHKRKKGVATITVYEKDRVSQSGIVLLDNHDKILKFIEKPEPEEAISHLVNAGLYILEPGILNYIPSNKVVDFGKDVFPKMIQKGENMFGVIVKDNLMAIDTPKLLIEALRITKKEKGG
jgi:NDP-sugar pyrophosphorylase family protein